MHVSKRQELHTAGAGRTLTHLDGRLVVLLNGNVSKKEPETVSMAYLSSRLLHIIIPTVAADRGIQRSAHTPRFGREHCVRLQWR
jgi:hypothetical protein